MLSAYVMKGRFQAVAAATVFALLSLVLPPLTILSSAIVALVTLRKGRTEGFIVVAIAAIAGVVLGEFSAGVPYYAVTYFLIQWLPIWLAATLLRETGSPLKAISFLAFLGAAAIVLFYLFVDSPAEEWTAILKTVLEPIVEMGSEVEQGVLLENLEVVSHYMSGIVVMSSLASLALALFLGRWWQANLYNPGGFGQELLALRMPKNIAIFTLVVIVFSLLGLGFLSELAGNVALPMLVLYLIAGVSVLHLMLSASKARRFLLMGMYLMLFIIPHILPPIILVGFADTWLDLRKYIRVENNS
ncbi:MAG: hypothetical protein DRQ56_06565 [Gammaproteobacteria bacterium]|nr:MAG: hypothetical protein DRQ56_06565 [Gammaproteobacteria bacterium]